MRNVRQRLEDMREAIARISARMPASLDDFQADEMLQVWMVYHLQTLVEAARGIPEASREQYPRIPWRGLIGLRNVVVHEYFRLDAASIYEVLESEIPDLARLLDSALSLPSPGEEDGTNQTGPA